MLRRHLHSLLTVAAVALAWPAAAVEKPPAFEGGLHRDHPLVGEIRRVRDGATLTPDQAAAELASGRFVLLGEQHDNPDHHALQAWAVRALAGQDRRPAVAFEMIDRTQADALAAHLAERPADAAGLGAAVRWDDRGWPDWAMYQPIAEAALTHDLPLVAADAGPELTRTVGRQGLEAAGALDADTLGLATPLPEAQRAALRQELQVSHCNMLPDGALGPMAQVQRLRDAVMADSLIAAARDADGAVLIVGGGHVRADRGIPWYLRRRLDDPDVVTVRFLEVRPDATDWRAWKGESGYRVHPTDPSNLGSRLFPIGPSLVMLLVAFGLYPVLLWATLEPAFPLLFNLLLGVCLLVLVGYLASMPPVGVAVFGTWTVFLPTILTLGLGVPAYSPVIGAVVVGTAVPLVLSVAIWAVLRV